MNKQIVEVWNEVEDDFPDKSTEFLMAMTCDRYRERYGRDIDNADIAGALFEVAEADDE